MFMTIMVEVSLGFSTLFSQLHISLIFSSYLLIYVNNGLGIVNYNELTNLLVHSYIEALKQWDEKLSLPGLFYLRTRITITGSFTEYGYMDISSGFICDIMKMFDIFILFSSIYAITLLSILF